MENSIGGIIGRNISTLRKSKGLTQDGLAGELGVSFQAVSKWETGQSCPDISLIPIIADFFDISIDELFDRIVAAKITDKEPRYDLVMEVPWQDDEKIRMVVYQGKKLLVKQEDIKEFTFSLEGEVRDVVCHGNINGAVNAGGDVCCVGSIGGNVATKGDISVDGSIGGDVATRGNVNCGGAIGGDLATDSGNVNCSVIGGSVTTDCGSVTCKDIYGGLKTNGSVECETIKGNCQINGCGALKCNSIEGDMTSYGRVECNTIGGNVTMNGGTLQCEEITGETQYE